MILSIIIWIFSVGISCSILFFTDIYRIWWADLIGLVAIPVIYLLVLGAILFILFFVGLIIKPRKENTKPSKLAYWWTFQVNYILCKLTCSIKVIGKEKVPTDRRFLMVFNHRSNWDPMVLMSEFRKYNLYFVTKPSNLNIPIAGPFMHRGGFIPVNREDNKEGLKSIVKATKIIQSNYGSIGIAPEGTRNKKLEKPLLDFHAGSFKIATKTNCPIVVAKVMNCEKIHKNFPFKRTRVIIEILDVLEYEDFKDKSTVEISSEVHNMMEESIGKETN
jgi:1-acyl-sn-glycerol-3-phosphate acyltransferase